MHEDHEVSRHARRKDTLSAEDLGILLQWHWKYGTSTFANERQRVQMGRAPDLPAVPDLGEQVLEFAGRTEREDRESRSILKAQPADQQDNLPDIRGKQV